MNRIPQENTFATFDGTRLFYRHWPAATSQPKGAIILFHRGHEHSGRLQHLVDELALPEYAFFAWDARGHGNSPGERGDAQSVGALVRDVDTFVAYVSEHYSVPYDQIAVVAQSVGAVLVSAWALDYAPPIRAMVLASPAFSVKLYIPFALPALRLRQKLRGNFFINSYVKAKFLTHDQERAASYDKDTLITRAISARILTGLYSHGARVAANSSSITIPTQLFISGADYVVRHFPQHAFFNNLPCPDNERHVLPGFFHDTLGEKDRAIPLEKIHNFITAQFAKPRWHPNLTRADKEGPSAIRLKWLQTPYSCCSLKGLYYRLGRLGLTTLGKLSQGVRIGLETGFDSGTTLDYVYENTPRGTSPLGRLIDTTYLQSPGWTGIRARKQHLQEIIPLAASFLHQAGTPVRLLDVAAGHGRYILDSLEAMQTPYESALLRDFSEINVQAGQKAIRSRGLEAKVQFVRGDAFDPESIASITPQPTLGVVSGLYELFPANELLEKSLHGLAQAIPAGGYLVYTNQPWHPQLEYIARVLTSHKDGLAWAMRCRSQAEMDQLVARAGFQKITQRADEHGIFTVSLACRLP